MKLLFIKISFLALVFCACKNTSKNESNLFKSLNDSGIDFENRLTETDSINYFNYHYLYMGGGVSLGDINNDGLTDIYLTGNMVPNKLYLNKGDMTFKDITEEAAVSGDNRWMTGVTMADVNNDGRLDIYINVSGKWEQKNNLLYINMGNRNGVPYFQEMAKEYGIDDAGNSVQSVFFDYDVDGDLDLFVANYPITPFDTSARTYKYLMDNVSDETSDRLYENTGSGKFIDVTKKAGLMNFGLSLGAMVGDYNHDGLPDLYVSNDFASKDYFYLNNGDGTFTDQLDATTKHTAFYGMGCDAADINNDGLLDFIQVDMTPDDNRRSKANMASMNPKRFWDGVNLGFHYQYMQNVLQINNGVDENRIPHFSDVAHLANAALTDWSWAPLFADLDNDGLKDIFITNGTRKEINNKDYFKNIDWGIDYFGNKVKEVSYKQLSEEIPSERVENVALKNNGSLSFTQASNWGLDFSGFSNGAAYADLDNDGDLDIVVNNIDDPALIYENTTNTKTKNKFLRFKFKGPKSNPLGIGTEVLLENKQDIQHQYLMLTRGFQSSVEPIIHFGVGKTDSVEKVKIIWPDGKQQILNDVATNQVYTIDYGNSDVITEFADNQDDKIFRAVNVELGLEHNHKENDFNDFKDEVLLPHKMSQFGPGLVSGDVNNDGLDDFYIGGAKGFEGTLYVQKPDGTFYTSNKNLWINDNEFEDVGALFFDANGDNWLDLYVVSGGNEFDKNSELLQDRLYINSGYGQFYKSSNALPEILTSGSRVVAADYDNDGDIDLFVGGRLIPKSYPLPADSYILENIITKSNEVKFRNVTDNIAPALKNIGLVTDACWVDFDNDEDLDLIVVGEWMPITFLENVNGTYKNRTEAFGFENTTGWWNAIEIGDFNDDGYKDFVVGNLGLNYKYKASDNEPFNIYSQDFDENGKLDIVLGYYNKGVEYPVRGRQCSSEQIPVLADKFKNYNTFAIASLEDVYTEQALEESIHYEARTFASSCILNMGNGEFKINKLPNEAQISSINDFVVSDFNNDGHLDLLTAGNLYTSEVETTRNDASYGLLLKGNGEGTFNCIPSFKSGLLINGDTKALTKLRNKKGEMILAANNDGLLNCILINGK